MPHSFVRTRGRLSPGFEFPGNDQLMSVSQRGPRHFRTFVMLASAAALSGCATAGSTIRGLQAQTAVNRELLAIERQRTGDLLARRASLQSQIARKRQILSGLESSSSPDGAEVSSIKHEIAQLETEVSALTKTVNEME